MTIFKFEKFKSTNSSPSKKEGLRLIILQLFLFCTTLSIAQIPNPSFENWTSGRPNGWHSLEDGAPYIFETQDNTAYQGDYAVRSSQKGISGMPPTHSVVVAGIMTGDVTWSGYDSNKNKYGYIKCTAKPNKLIGWYILHNQKYNDTLNVSIWFKNAGTIIGTGQFTTTTANAPYNQFVANINYTSSLAPDSFKIFITFNHWYNVENQFVGDYFLIDNLAFDNSVGIENNSKIEREIKVYPNPTKELLTIQIFDTNSKITSAEIYNSSGQLVQQFKPDDSLFHINTQNHSSGLYHYKLMLNDGTNKTGRFVKQ